MAKSLSVLLLSVAALVGVFGDATDSLTGDGQTEAAIREGSIAEGSDAEDSQDGEDAEGGADAFSNVDLEQAVGRDFKEADANGSGFLEEDEVTALMKMVHAPHASQWRSFDTDKDGALSQSELLEFARNSAGGDEQDDEMRHGPGPASMLEEGDRNGEEGEENEEHGEEGEENEEQGEEGEEDEEQDEGEDEGDEEGGGEGEQGGSLLEEGQQEEEDAEADEEADEHAREDEDEDEDQDTEIDEAKVDVDFKQFDEDKSGFLEQPEVEALLQHSGAPSNFHWLPYDADKNGKLSIGELLELAKDDDTHDYDESQFPNADSLIEEEPFMDDDFAAEKGEEEQS